MSERNIVYNINFFEKYIEDVFAVLPKSVFITKGK